MNYSYAIILVLSGLTAGAAVAEEDYGRLNKDVRIMGDIIESAFESTEYCGRRCNIRLSGRYLAEQGVVFTVGVPRHMRFWHSSHDGDNFEVITDFSELEKLEGLAELESLADIPDIVHEALSGVHFDIRTDGDEIYTTRIRAEDAENREAIRELRREQREVQDDLRAVEVAIIQVQDDDEARTRLEETRERYEAQQQELEERRAALEAEREAAAEAMRARRDAQRSARLESEAKRQRGVEDVVLGALCDYGSALKHLPGDERVSVILERDDDEPASVFVMRKRDLSGCGDAGELRGKAVAYTF